MKRRGPRGQGVILALLAVFLLAGCGPIAFSPEAAVMNELQNAPRHDATIVPNSIQVVQTHKAGDQTFVMVRFKEDHHNFGRMACLFLYEIQKSPFGGWITGSGGGGCSSDPPSDQAIQVGSNISMGDGTARRPGFSAVYGEVLDPKVASVKVTWDDGQEQEVDVIQSAYLVVRPAAPKARYETVTALDADGNEIFTNIQPQPAPGKTE